jgi:hypothetical protein
MKSFSYTELDKLTGEVLPERAVLSTLLTGGGHGGGNDNDNANLNVNHGGDHGGTTAVVPLCQSTVTNQGGLAGILAESSSSSFACASAAVASGH